MHHVTVTVSALPIGFALSGRTRAKSARVMMTTAVKRRVSREKKSEGGSALRWLALALFDAPPWHLATGPPPSVLSRQQASPRMSRLTWSLAACSAAAASAVSAAFAASSIDAWILAIRSCSARSAALASSYHATDATPSVSRHR